MLKRAARCIPGSMAPSHNALSSRGTPNPDYAIVRTRPSKAQSKARASRKPKAQPVQSIDFASALAAAEIDMHNAQSRVRVAKQDGRPYADLAAEARRCRAAYLALSGGVEHRAITVDMGSTVNPLIAV